MSEQERMGPIRAPLLLSELVKRPDLLVPPPAILPHLALEGRVTLLAAPEKSGKSTLMRQAVAALLRGGDFLGESVDGGTAAWVALDEPLGDLVRGFNELGCSGGLAVWDFQPTMDELSAEIRKEEHRVLVVDTLLELVAGRVLDANSASEWVPWLRDLRDIAQGTDCAIVLLHHQTKGRTGYADSRQIGAGVDVIILMDEVSDAPTRRRFKVRGRGVRDDFTLDWDRDSGYQVSQGDLSMDARILAVVATQPGISKTQLRGAVSGATKDKDAAIAGLLYRHAIRDLGEHGGHAYFLPDSENGRVRAESGVSQGVGEWR